MDTPVPTATSLRASIQALRDELQRRHGATHLDVVVELDEAARRAVVNGAVLVHRLTATLRGRLSEVLPPDWRVDTDGVRIWEGGAWRALVTPLVLHARFDDTTACTVLRAHDGPVQELVACGAEQLVRARDGTAGWTTGPLGDVVAPRLLERPTSADPLDLLTTARAYLGVRYELAGTDDDAIDCSGLVQRALRRGLGILVPRHTTDQRAIDPRPGRPPDGAGHLVFVWTQGEAQCHVGIAAGKSVIHASRSRMRVVEDDAAPLYAAASRVEHVPFASLLAFGERVAGSASLIAAGFELGR